MLEFLRHRRPRNLNLCVTIVVEPDGDGFHAFAPGLKGLHTDGQTQDEALLNAVDAVKLYLESMANHGDPLPVGPDCVVTPMQVPEHYQVPVGAFMKHVTLEWPSLQTSGIN